MRFASRLERGILSLGLILLMASASRAEQQPTASLEPEPLRLNVSRDTWFSEVGVEADANLGGANKLKVKSIQELALIDVDPAPLVGRTVASATLHAFGRDLRRVTVGSFASDWVEGTSGEYKPQDGSSSFRSQRHPHVPWTVPGSDLTAVMLGQGGTVWRMADASPVDAKGWQQVPVDPVVVAARVAGISRGFIVFDDTGSEWTHEGDKFSLHLFPNRYLASRESGARTAPYLTVTLGSADAEAPAAPREFLTQNEGLPAGEARVSWLTPADRGAAGTVGFFATLDGKPVPRYLIPAAGRPEQRVTMHLRDLGLSSPDKVMLRVEAVDGAGNRGPASQCAVRLSEAQPVKLPDELPKNARVAGGRLPRLGECEVAILDPLDKVQPVSGAMIPPQDNAYLLENHLWSAAVPEIRLQAARNEFVGFQILLRGKINGVKPELIFDAPASDDRPVVSFLRYRHVLTPAGPLPDPLVPLSGPISVPDGDEQIAGQQSASLLCEVYVPHRARAGEQPGELVLQTEGASLKIPLRLTVCDFTLPDHLSFLPEMNCYGLPANERDYYRLAQIHRTVLNRVPYHHNGQVEPGCAPFWNGRQLDWDAWDKRFGPYLDGSAFADLPRGKVPVECFYLPIFENWPSSMADNYRDAYWADRAFPPAYREALIEVSQQMSRHFDERGWRQTLFQFFLNGKNNFKAQGWSRSTCPWLLDEPANFQDYWALRWFGQTFHEGVARAGGNAKMLFRCDISRPQWQRDALDGVLDYPVIGGQAFRQYRSMVLDRRDALGQIVVDYGSSNAIEASNLQSVGWALDSWTLGSDGIVPWQTIGTPAAWKQGSAESLFYPSLAGEAHEPLPSIRLKAYRRGQQDVEYLTLFMRHKNAPRWAVAQSVRAALKLAAVRESTGFVGGEDAGVLTFGDLRPQDVAALRMRIGQALSAARLAPAAKLVDFDTPRRSGRPPSPGEVAGTEAQPEVSQQTASPISKRVVKTLQGRGAIVDALITFETPEQNLGNESRNNALRRADQTNAFLIKFDLSKLAANARVHRATLSFYVWDPSSAGQTKVVAARLKAPWDENSVNWLRAAAGRAWQGPHFDAASDTADPTEPVSVKPDESADTVDPPQEYQLDVTNMVRAWLSGPVENQGLAILPRIDRAIDDGQFSRFQIYASEIRRAEFGPKLTVELEP